MLTLLAIGAAVLVLLALVDKAAATVSSVSEIQNHRRGQWGLLSWSRTNRSDLLDDERRWHTSLLQGQRSESQWAGLVSRIEDLGHSVDLVPDPDPPAEYDSFWITSRLDLIDSALAANGPASSDRVSISATAPSHLPEDNT